ncbi:MAG: DUF624 domain-containing protein [Clostridiaceae bacterium]|nr:DUF624 domain-containing protein [Clostridiaceae bacterium]
MAGFFGLFDYNKPGPGVPKDAPPKSPFIVFFQILQRKFWNFIKVNIMFLIFNLPALVLGMLAMLYFFPNIFPNAMNDPEMLLNDTMLKFILLTIMMCLPMVTVGPAQAGFTYIMRNYSREEHAFLWGDFKDTAKKNMKQSLIVSAINFIVTFLMLFSIRAYYALIEQAQIPQIIGLLGISIMSVMFALFACMSMYIYPTMITFDLSLKNLYKNSFIFAVIKFLPNIGILLLCALIVFLSFGMIITFNPLIGFIPYFLLTFSLIGFITNFYVYPKLEKYIIARIDEEDDDDDDDDDEDEDEGGGNYDNVDFDDKEVDFEEEEGEDKDEDEDEIKRYF